MLLSDKKICRLFVLVDKIYFIKAEGSKPRSTCSTREERLYKFTSPDLHVRRVGKNVGQIIERLECMFNAPAAMPREDSNF